MSKENIENKVNANPETGEKKKRSLRSVDEMRTSLEQWKSNLKHSTEEMNAKMKQMLADEIEAYKRREKHRAGVYSAAFAEGKTDYRAKAFADEFHAGVF